MIDARAYVLRERGTVPEIENIQIKDLLQQGQVLVEIINTSFCGTQVEEIFISSRNAKYMPHLLGHEASARVLKIGPGVLNVQTGQEVVVHWRESSRGLDSVSGEYHAGGEKLSSGKVVTLSTHAVVPENRISPIPSGIPTSSAALLGCSYSTGWGAVIKSGGLRPGESVLVIGFGGVGRAAVVAALTHGARSIEVIEPRDLSNSDISALGVAKVFTSIDQYLSSNKEAGDKYPELLIDTAGVVNNLEKLIAQVPTNSRLILVGMPKNGERLQLDTQKLLDGLTVKGSNGGDIDPSVDLNHMPRGLDKYIGESQDSGVMQFDWSELKEALELQSKGVLTKAIFSVSPP
jgi:S-(hydroxymethyl)glutathione dehydrogenase / alcohol dehydrogenase